MSVRLLHSLTWTEAAVKKVTINPTGDIGISPFKKDQPHLLSVNTFHDVDLQKI